MSIWVYITKDEFVLEVNTHQEGEHFVLGGTSMAEVYVSITMYQRMQEIGINIFNLHNEKAKDTIVKLTEASIAIGDHPHEDDFWDPQPKNANHILRIFLKWAEDNPGAVWKIV